MENNLTIGEHLKSARESKGLRLEDIAQKTKININILRSLESNSFEKLPNRTYVRGFVQNYAKTLGIEIENAVELLDETLKSNGIEVDDVPSNPILDQFVEETDLSSEFKKHELRGKIANLIDILFKKKTILIILIILVGGFGLKYLVNFFGQLKIEGKLASAPKTQEVVVSEVKEDESIKNENEDLFDLKVAEKLEKTQTASEPVVEEKVAQQPEEIKEDKKVEPEIKEEEKTEEVSEKPSEEVNLQGKFPYVDFYPAPRNLYTIVEDAAENDDESLLPSNIKSLMEEGKANVYIRAVDGDTWISYKVDDEKITRYILKQGRYTLLKGDTVLLFMGNINVAKVFYNNQLIDTNSRTGVKSLIFPEEKAENFVFPLFPNYKGIPYPAEEYQKNMQAKPE